MSNKSVSFKKAVLLNASSKYITVVLQLVYTAILSRILTPAEYGTVAIINVFIVFFNYLQTWASVQVSFKIKI